VADQLAHDGAPRALDDLLDGVADVAEAVPTDHGADGRSERRLGRRDQRLGLAVGVADDRAERGVAVVALDERAAVDRDQVAVLERAVVGDAVDDHVVGARADHTRERRAPVAQEVRPRTPGLDHLTTDAVELEGRDTGLDGLADAGVHLCHHPARPPHRGDLVGAADHRRALPRAGAARRSRG
jgi:hypothetical protein